MQQLLVYADSLTWGIIPDTRQRLPFQQRWPGVMEIALTQQGHSVRVIEDCLNGRRTVFEDPFKPGRNGQKGLAQCIEMHSPLTLVILMLGSNDFQSMHHHNAWHASQGIASLIQTIRNAPIEPGMPIPPVMVIAPPPITSPKGLIAPKFKDAETKSTGLAAAYQAVCNQLDSAFFDAGTVVSCSQIDGIHLDADQHAILGLEIAKKVNALLP
jgi:lysophospholipase L1-like esterase